MASSGPPRRPRLVPAPVPEGRGERIAKLGAMLAGIAGDTALEWMRRAAGSGDEAQGHPVLNDASVSRLTETLADLRGAAMKLGQLLSLQGDALLPGPLAAALAELQDQARFMPRAQVDAVLRRELGRDWAQHFAAFDYEPLAAASIGQVHAVRAADGRELALKLQYPGVDRSIDADVDNLALLLRVTRLLPPEIDLTALVPEVKRELHLEADYRREARSTVRYRELLGDEPRVFVPRVHADLSTRRALATDRVYGRPLEDLRSPEHPAELRDAIGAALLRVVLRELFEFRLVQSDPNFANYLWEPERGRVALIDFGSVRRLTKARAETYRELVLATAQQKPDRVVAVGEALGMLTGRESPAAREAFVELVDGVGEPLRVDGPFDFAGSGLLERVRELGVDAYLRRGLPQPPTDLLLVHRKIAGSYLLLAHIGARCDCAALTRETLGPGAA